MQLLGKLLGDPNKRDLKALQPLVDKINALEPTMQKLSDQELAAKTTEFRSQLFLYLKGGMVLEDELVSLFREALSTVDGYAEQCSDADLHTAVNPYRLTIERRDNPEHDLLDNLNHTLSECFEQSYEKLCPKLNRLKVERAMQLAEAAQSWYVTADEAEQTVLKALAQAEPVIDQIDAEIRSEAFTTAWQRLERHHDGPLTGIESARDFEQLLSDTLRNLQPEVVALKADAMDQLIPAMAKRYRNGKTLDDLLPEAFAVVREAGRRTIKMRHFDVQLLGGIVLHQGKIAEMRTGEGKTLVATLPSYLNALTGKGVHVVTVNDYLARRDAEWMGQIYKFLGLTVGIIVNAVEPQSAARRAAYQADITYGTNNEFGFDYLRDNMVTSLDQMVQRNLNYAIIDEVDNILIDEARTPLIISGQGQESTDMYVKFARWAKTLKPETDYTVDEKLRTVMLTESGIEKIERLAGVQNIYDEANIDLTRYMENAIKAEVLFKRDKDYIVKDGEVIIVDEFTGRQMIGRRYSEGLHQAIEAKEGVKVQRENHTLATVTFQNYFRLYKKLAGMTGTALTEAEELHKIYKLDVVVIPTHKEMIRQDLPDLIYRTQKAKFKAVVEEIKARHAKGQPVLVGTTSVEISEYLSSLLEREGIPHNVLNAKHHEREAHIVAQAGRSGAVTIATNMAGRGTDILLGGNPTEYFAQVLRKHAEQVDYIREMPARNEDEREEKEEAIREYLANMTEEEKEKIFRQVERDCEKDHELVVKLGGLHIIGTERHESRRIDNQLRGRAGRQGDPGSSRFYLSLEDELMRRFAADRVSALMERFGMDDDTPLESSMVSKLIESAQAKVEGYNFDIRKNVVEYDDVIAKQREVIYADRRAVLERADLHERVLNMIRAEVAKIVDSNIPGPVVSEEEQLQNVFNMIEAWVPIPDDLIPENVHAVRREQLKQQLTDLVVNHYEMRARQIEEQQAPLKAENPDMVVFTIRDLERSYTLQIIDRLWMDHIDALDVMRAGIGFRAIGQRDPLVEFKNEAYIMFENLKDTIQHYIVDSLLKLLRNDFTITIQRPEPPRKAPTKLRTNADEIARASGQSKSDSGEERPAKSSVQRNGAPRSGNARPQSRSTASGKVAAATASTASGNSIPKVGRNDPCPCGSGKKYKKCHGA
jgi:preprotein translocase subunit SecA